MKDYKNISCIEGEYFTCPETIPPYVEDQEDDGIISQDLPLSTDDYNKSGVKVKSYKLYEK
jgi:hypothetical protein